MHVTRRFHCSCLLSTILLLLTGCYSGKTLLNRDDKPGGNMNVSEYSTISENDKFQYVNAGLSVTMFTQMAISPGTKFQFGNLDKGFITGNLQYNSRVGDTKNIFNNFESNKKTPTFLAQTTYSFPLTRKFGKGRVKIPLGGYSDYQNGGAYTIDENSPFIQSLLIEGGLSYTHLYFSSDLWATNTKNEINDAYFENGYPNGSANIHQGVISAYFGARVSHFMNTFISGKSENRNYIGTKKEQWDVHLGLKPLIFSISPDIRYEYTVTENSNTIDVQEYINPKTFLTKSLLGFNIGVSKIMFYEISRKFGFTISNFGQIGVDPGYCEKYLNNFYFRYGLMIGWSNGSDD